MSNPGAKESKNHGSYKLLNRIGQGGMARVYRAEHLADRSIVALKVFNKDDLTSPEFVKRIKREIATLKQCSHPNIVKVHGYALSSRGSYLALHYIDGQTIDEAVEAEGRFSTDRVVRLAREMGGALAYCHARGLIHRDIKPANIMIENGSGKAILLDFGVVKATNMTDISVMDQVRGTLAYMSPEQFLNRPVDGRTDLYTLGLVLVKAATGQEPFDQNKPMTLEDLTGNRPLPSVIERVPDFPEALEMLIHNCLMADPRERYASAHDLLADIEKVEAGEPVKSRARRRTTIRVKPKEFQPVVSTLRMDRREALSGSVPVALPTRKWIWMLGLSPLLLLVAAAVVMMVVR